MKRFCFVFDYSCMCESKAIRITIHYTGRMQNLTVKRIECGLFLDEKAASFDLRDANGIQRRTVCVCVMQQRPATALQPPTLPPAFGLSQIACLWCGGGCNVNKPRSECFSTAVKGHEHFY